MTSSPERVRRPHGWLLQAAQAAEPSRAKHLPESLPDNIVEAWGVTMTQSGLSAAALAKAAGDVLHLPVADATKVDRRAIKLLPERVARALRVLPMLLTDDYLQVACADPLDLGIERDLEFASARSIRFVVASPDFIQEHLDAEYSPEVLIDAVVSGFAGGQAAVVIDNELEPPGGDGSEAHNASVRRLAATLLRDAAAQGASDIHLTPNGTQGVVRYRIDGTMRPVLTMPDAVYARVVSRLKVIGNLDVADSRRPQDGRSRIVIGGREIDLRISSLPVEGGRERLVLRLLTHEAIGSLDSLDLVEPERSQLLALMDLADGMVLMTGPTGSGKTTTLHAALRRRLKPSVTIMTVENPVEYRISGISQVQVEPKAGLTFAAALRAILRQDPDIVLVGEIRDRETAEVAAQAAMTGHLMLSTVHADDAPGALLRLRDLGLAIDTLSETFRGAAAQRLVRRVCATCVAAPAVADATPEELTFQSITGALPKVRAVGCPSCDFTGYSGRLPIHQIFRMTEAIKTLLVHHAPTGDVRAKAREEGMRSLGESALSRIEAGQTTVAEALRVLGTRFWDEIRGLDTSEHAEPTDATDMELEETGFLAKSRAARLAPTSVVVFSEDDEVREQLRRGAKQAGADVLTADSVEAVAKAAARTPNIRLLVLDLGPDLPPEETGAMGLLVDLRRALRELSLPVLLVAPPEHTALHFMLSAAGVDDFLRRPVDEALLERRVRAALRRSVSGSAVVAEDA